MQLVFKSVRAKEPIVARYKLKDGTIIELNQTQLSYAVSRYEALGRKNRKGLPPSLQTVKPVIQQKSAERTEHILEVLKRKDREFGNLDVRMWTGFGEDTVRRALDFLTSNGDLEKLKSKPRAIYRVAA